MLESRVRPELTTRLFLIPVFELGLDVHVFFLLGSELVLHYFELLLECLQYYLLPGLHRLL